MFAIHHRPDRQAAALITAVLTLAMGALPVTAAAPAGAHVRLTGQPAPHGKANLRPPHPRSAGPQRKRAKARAAAARRRVATAAAAAPYHAAGNPACDTFNGVTNLTTHAFEAGMFEDRVIWSDTGIGTIAPQWIYFRVWAGRPDSSVAGGMRWFRGNWARTNVGSPFTWQAYLGGAWVDTVDGNYGVLAYSVATYVGDLSYIPIRTNTSYYLYYEWQWGLADANGNPTGPWRAHWDTRGWAACGA